MESPSTLEVLKFVIKHRKAGGSFTDVSISAVARRLLEASQTGQLLITSDKLNTITGIIIAYPLLEKVLFVEQMLCITTESFKQFRSFMQSKYPGYQLAYERHGRLRQYKHI
jgi:hypothetical protein